MLRPKDPDNYYQALDSIPADLRESLGKDILKKEGIPSPFTETPAEMVRRVCASLDPRHDIIVLNDEAHHCYRGKPTEEKLTGDERKEIEAREEDACIWISGEARPGDTRSQRLKTRVAQGNT